MDEIRKMLNRLQLYFYNEHFETLDQFDFGPTPTAGA